ncbi:MAG: PhzF family phenazine biosynthesis protein [Dokdonella sp.]
MLVSRYLQLDVFARTMGGGNPLGVVIDADGWSAEQMQTFARWTNLVETTFLLPPTDAAASYRVRIFTPTSEIGFAGHPTIGSAHAVLEFGIANPSHGVLIQECAAGLLPIRVDRRHDQRDLFVRSPAARLVEAGSTDEDRVRSLLANVTLGRLPPAFVEGGRRWWLAELESEDELRAWQPDHSRITSLAAATQSMGLCIFARSDSSEHALVVRAFPAGVGIVEDPASGAANGLIAAYIAGAEPNGSLANGYRVSQGREIGRDATINVDILDGAIWIGGRTNTIVNGQVAWD